MPVELIPSVLATTPRQLNQRWARAEALGKVVHLDIMDGVFVRQRSVSASSISHYQARKPFEVHAMVKRIDVLESVLTVCRPQLVYLPVELKSQRPLFERLVRRYNAEVGYAISPKTSLTTLWPILKNTTSILVMSVYPGRYGAPFLPSTVRRITTVRKQRPKARIMVDGGMDKVTIPRCIAAGCSGVIVGSDVMLRRNPGPEWRRLRRLTVTV